MALAYRTIPSSKANRRTRGFFSICAALPGTGGRYVLSMGRPVFPTRARPSPRLIPNASGPNLPRNALFQGSTRPTRNKDGHSRGSPRTRNYDSVKEGDEPGHDVRDLRPLDFPRRRKHSANLIGKVSSGDSGLT